MTTQNQFKPRDPLLPGVERTINSQTLTVPAPLMIKSLELAEATEKLMAGSMTSSQFMKARNAVVEHTIRRNYPDIPESWFAELDTAQYLSLNQALAEACSSGEMTPTASL